MLLLQLHTWVIALICKTAGSVQGNLRFILADGVAVCDQRDFRLKRSHLQTLGRVTWHLGHLEKFLVQLSLLSPILILLTSVIGWWVISLSPRPCLIFCQHAKLGKLVQQPIRTQSCPSSWTCMVFLEIGTGWGSNQVETVGHPIWDPSYLSKCAGSGIHWCWE